MSFAAALLIVAQGTAATAAPIAVSGPSAPVAERVNASVEILRPVRIVVAEEEQAFANGESRKDRAQRRRDDAGTLWIEFS